MTDDEMRTLIAERVMGWWQPVKSGEWVDRKTGLLGCWICEWHPEFDVRQAMMAAETLRLQHGWEYVITAKTPYQQTRSSSNKGKFSCHFIWDGQSSKGLRIGAACYAYEAHDDALPRAIFMAAAQVAEEMGAE